MVTDDGVETFQRLAIALRPFLNDLVIVGGWAHRLYRNRPEVTIPLHEPLFTTDTDIAIAPGAPLPAKQLLEQLQAHGFVEDFLGDDRPPVTHYRLGNEDSGFYAEFLTPLLGGGGRPGRSAKDTAELGGVVAQRLRHLDILLIQPWSILVSGQSPEAPEGIVVRVPNPVAFIAQKLLTLQKRKPADRAKDLLYVHDTVELFGSSLDDLASLWKMSIRPGLERRADQIEGLARNEFTEVTDDMRRAARMASGRDLDPETLRRRCAIGLEALFLADDAR